MTPKNSQFNTPILFVIFNRPAVTKQVMGAIRQAKPARFYIAADGPRRNKESDEENCIKARTIVQEVDWDCEVKTLFQDENLGCGIAVADAINWFFEHESEGIILEDDCLPAPDFFPFCHELLDRYRNDNRIMAISGCNLVPEQLRSTEYSYTYSNHNNIWGWATWKRAWKLYDFEMSDYKKVKEMGYLKNSFSSSYEYDYFEWVFERTFLFPTITWDYQWEFTRRINSGLTILPQKNLISNLGFGEDATHTTNPADKSSKLKLESLAFPLLHPEFMIVDKAADKIAFIEHYTNASSRFKSVVKNLLPAKIRNKLFIRSMERFIQDYQLESTAPKNLNDSSIHRRVQEPSTLDSR